MPRIERVTPITEPTGLISWKRRSYESPTSRWNFVLRDPREWHMGADGWKAELWRGARNVPSIHRDAWQLADGIGFRACDAMRPWSADDRTLALLTWRMESPVWLYDVEGRRLERAPVQGALPHSAQWAPRLDRLLLPSRPGRGCSIRGAVPQGSVAWNVTNDELFTDWTRSCPGCRIPARYLACRSVRPGNGYVATGHLPADVASPWQPADVYRRGSLGCRHALALIDSGDA